MDTLMFKIMFRRLWVSWSLFKEKKKIDKIWGLKALSIILGFMFFYVQIAFYVLCLVSHKKVENYFWFIALFGLIILWNTPAIIKWIKAWIDLNKKNQKSWFYNSINAIEAIFNVQNSLFFSRMFIFQYITTFFLAWSLITVLGVILGLKKGFIKIINLPKIIQEKNEKFLKENPQEEVRLVKNRLNQKVSKTNVIPALKNRL